MTGAYIRSPSGGDYPEARTETLNDGVHDGRVSAAFHVGFDTIDYAGSSGELDNPGTRRLEVFEDVYESGGTTDEHAHDDFEQFYYVLSGEAEITVGDETERVGPGGRAYMPPNVPHSARFVGDESVRLLIVNVRL